ncbi:T9SS type A sorting domain-containing protein [Microvirga sp. STS02]|uniref:T9SS type A sorting domain-containing protein n=1 Tax=Hymenobacter negativus TaxID=2795026 RepID=UPI0018DB337D|nr:MULTISPECIES: T9SS type A sorting domain-containing protein [Bacteria]MBH8570083.1 T9SS type A sorting domain-containing protein [Hymenobacter negativus]MBR7209823.1 T9SS type A sorting domain-containing protein [Microvirga sp. STS02]
MKHLSSFLRGSLPAALLLLLWLAGPAARAQAPAWQTAMAVSGNGSSAVNAMATDANGNVYLVGDFRFTLRVGSFSLTSVGLTDIFVAKWSTASNSFVWAQRAGGINEDYANAISVNGTNIYIAGRFSSAAASFGSTVLTNTGNYSNFSYSDVFVAKLTDGGSSGSFIWAQSAGGAYVSEATALAVSGTSVYVAGNFSGPASFGTTTLAAAGPPPYSNSDVFVAKLTDAGPSGSFGWAQRAGGTGIDKISAMAANATGIYVTGNFYSSTADFGATTLSSIGATLFVAKLLDLGTSDTFSWIQQGGGPAGDVANALVLNGTSLYIAGDFGSPTVSFGTSILTNANTNGSGEVFVAKLTDLGTGSTWNWAQRAGGSATDYANSLAVSGINVYVTGGFRSSTAGFGSTIITNAAATGNEDIFVAKLLDGNSSATWQWAQRAGSTSSDVGQSLAMVGTTLFVAGNSGSGATFGSLSLSGIGGGFLATLTDPTLTATSAAQISLSFTLAPNPARTAATLTLPALPGTGMATLTLRDALGRTLRTETVALPAAGLRHPLDLRGLAPGIYAVQVQAGSTAATRRLVVE